MFGAYPFFRYSFFLIIGILIEMCFRLPPAGWLAISALAVIVFLYAFIKRELWLYQGFLMAVIVISFGGILLQIKTHIPDSRLLHADLLKAVISEAPQRAKNGFKVEAVLQRFRIGDSNFVCKEKVMLFLNDSLRYGSVVWIKGAVSIPSPAQVPQGFDYRKYLESKQIFFTKYIKAGNYHLTSEKAGNFLMDFSIALRANLVQKIKSFVPGKNESAIASAMVLGVKGSWDESLRDDYARSGTLHILAVSGMHVGLLYASLLWLLGPLRKKPAGLWFSSLIVIAALTLYGIVTGMSASVVRAVAMCILLEIAALFGKRPSLMNTVFLSAFVLLCFEPYLIKDIGFQLSYVALLGIIVWSSSWSELIETKYTFVNTVSSVFCTTLAAQLAVAPLGLLYFHQFPNLFWLSNIVVIPLSIGILYAGIALIMVSWFNALAIWLGVIISFFIKWVNVFIGFVADLPFSVTNDIYIGWLYVIGFYLILFWLTQAFFQRNKMKLWLSISMVCLLAVLRIADMMQKLDAKIIGVHYQDKMAAVYFQDGIRAKSLAEMGTGNGFIKYAGMNIVKLSNWNNHLLTAKADLLVVDMKFCGGAETIFAHFKPKTLVLTPAVSAKLQEEMQQIAKQNSILCHVMREQGYYEMEMK